MSDGAILELVSRGKKDAYQIQNPQQTWFGTNFETRSPSSREIRMLYPENQPRFGQWFDIVIPSDGDILMSLDLRITMPTWLPPEIASINTQTAAYKIQVASQPYEVKTNQYVPSGSNSLPFVFPTTPLQYGWCDGVANYIVGRWSLFVDNVIVLTGFGEFNTWFADLETSHNIAPVLHAFTGRTNESHGTSNGQIQANATLPELVFRVPIPGCQGSGANEKGLPICAFKHQKVVMRFWLLDKSALVESTELPVLTLSPTVSGYKTLPMYEISPAPWNGRSITINGAATLNGKRYKTLAAREMGHPTIYARCAILNVDNELRKSLQKQKFEIRFHQQLRDDWTIENSAFIPGANYRHVLSINGLFQTLFAGFRSDARTRQNKYTDVLPSSGDWVTQMSLNVNGQDRILPWDPKKFKTLANNTQFRRDINIALYYMIFGISPDNEPGGACNLSRCQKAILNLTFNAISPDPMTGTNVTYGFIFGQAWNILDIVEGVATLRFAN